MPAGNDLTTHFAGQRRKAAAKRELIALQLQHQQLLEPDDTQEAEPYTIRSYMQTRMQQLNDIIAAPLSRPGDDGKS